MLISSAPYRISFFGGGTDFPEFYKEHGGAVLSTTIDKYCYIFLRKFPQLFGVKHRFVWSHIELVNSIPEILHPAIKGAMEMLNWDNNEGIELHHFGDLPARSGMGSSSAFAAALLNGLQRLRGESPRPHLIMEQAIALEHSQGAKGCQDQVASAYGGFNFIKFNEDGKEISVIPVRSDAVERLQSKLLLFYTGTTRLSHTISQDMAAKTKDNTHELLRLKNMAYQGLNILLKNCCLDDFGYMLDEAWRIKRSLSSHITTDLIDGIYQQGKEAGALGGKILGAGGGGFILFYASEDRHANIKDALKDYTYVPFKFSKLGVSHGKCA